MMSAIGHLPPFPNYPPALLMARCSKSTPQPLLPQKVPPSADKIMRFIAFSSIVALMARKSSFALAKSIANIRGRRLSPTAGCRSLRSVGSRNEVRAEHLGRWIVAAVVSRKKPAAMVEKRAYACRQ
ncbi:hypothetical protein SJA_C1-31320 [Sphingobium indicum UT26S]|uniref:Uncharacterized protein n=1 Tax=Sphingobium indicum (strain DSM 16413 / CCM 7287 / MTCC 6362 / UT26 / NBRC 101211 / UT26S) TaxID=452662 RepID=D4Z5T4_SPHIU|nr:hypothetical protein SJA_C1-31320 [Sphingobium indicum UT26S]